MGTAIANPEVEVKAVDDPFMSLGLPRSHRQPGGRDQVANLNVQISAECGSGGILAAGSPETKRLCRSKTTRLVANGAVVYHKYLIQDLSATEARIGQ